jgi:hypothetical protein
MTAAAKTSLPSKLLLLLALPLLARPRLVVYGPSELKDKFEYSGKTARPC